MGTNYISFIDGWKGRAAFGPREGPFLFAGWASTGRSPLTRNVIASLPTHTTGRTSRRRHVWPNTSAAMNTSPSPQSPPPPSAWPRRAAGAGESLAAWMRVGLWPSNGGWRDATLAGPSCNRRARRAVLTPARRGGRGTDWICETNEKQSDKNAASAFRIHACLYTSIPPFPWTARNNNSSG